MGDNLQNSLESTRRGSVVSEGRYEFVRTSSGGRPHGTSSIGLGSGPRDISARTGWHFLHLFYQVDRSRLGDMSPGQREQGLEDLRRILGAKAPGGPEQFQCFAVPGHKADFGIVMAGPNLRGVHDVQMSIQASSLGPCSGPRIRSIRLPRSRSTFPTPSNTEGSSGTREGLDPESPTYKTKLAAYADRLVPMNRQRLYPEFPNWPCLCFYPMSKMRNAEQNWYPLPFEARAELMSHHARSGMKFAGRVSQLITASTGLDDWEWGVTLWGRNPSYLKDIVYTMRFDESSAKYALFGDFYFGYILPPDELLEAVRL